jgi:hypothetical protein
MKQEANKESSEKSHQNFPWAVLILCLAIIILAGIPFAFLTSTGKTIKDIIVDFGKPTTTINVNIKSYIPEVIGTKGDVLELAVSKEKEEFKREVGKKIAWEKINLGTTVSEIKLDATFRYYLQLSDPWRLAVKGNVCKVLAPRIRPTLPVAFDTSSMEKRTSSGWARFNKDETLAELEKSISTALEERASDPQHMKLAREECRRSVGEFVRNFLINKDYWRADGINAIVVVFPDETSIESLEELERYVSEPIQRLN